MSSSSTANRHRRLHWLLGALSFSVTLAVLTIWLGAAARPPDERLALDVGREVTFKLQGTGPEPIPGWNDVILDDATGREIIRLLQGAEPFRMQPHWQVGWNWPPVRQVYGPAPQFPPDDGLLEAYEPGNERPVLQLGLRLGGTGMVTPAGDGAYYFPPRHRQRLLALLEPLLEDFPDEPDARYVECSVEEAETVLVVELSIPDVTHERWEFPLRLEEFWPYEPLQERKILLAYGDGVAADGTGVGHNLSAQLVESTASTVNVSISCSWTVAGGKQWSFQHALFTTVGRPGEKQLDGGATIRWKFEQPAAGDGPGK